MPLSSFGLPSLALGTLLLLFACHSAMDHTGYLRVVDGSLTHARLPIDITIEAIAGLALALVGLYSYTGTFKPIRETEIVAQKNFDSYNHRPAFMVFNHRGALLGTKPLQEAVDKKRD